MRILFLTFYFQPDLCAGSFRATALVKALRFINPTVDIDVVTTLPNRYSTFSRDALEAEELDGVKIFRIELPPHKSGMLDQCLAFWAFSRQVKNIVRDKHYDLVIATSSRLMTAVLGAWIASRKGAHLYLDIRDIFVDTLNDILPRYLATLAKPIFSVLEWWAVKRAGKVNLVSQGFSEYFESRYPQQSFSYFTNGIDDDFLISQPKTLLQPKCLHPLRIVYAGNIGEGQGLHAILPELSQRMKGRVNFRIIGDGGRKELLQKSLRSAGVTNVTLVLPMSRDQLIEEYKQADVLFLHLNNYEAFKKVLPSKVFEYAAMGKPIWAGIPGFSADFIRSEITNAVVFSPCNAAEAEQVLDGLVIQDAPRSEFIEKFSRLNICHDMAKDIFNFAKLNSKIKGK